MDKPRPDDPQAVAERLVAWHNRHPLARRLSPLQVQSVGYVAVPFLPPEGAAPLPDTAAAAPRAAQAAAAAAAGDGLSLRERALARAQQGEAAGSQGGAGAAGAAPAKPAKARRAEAAGRPVKGPAQGPLPKPAFSEDFIAPLKPRQVARWLARQGVADPALARGVPVRHVAADPERAPRKSDVQTLYALTAMVEVGGQRIRPLLSLADPAAVLGTRLWSAARVSAAAGVTSSVLAAAGATAWWWPAETSPDLQARAPVAAAGLAASAALAPLQPPLAPPPPQLPPPVAELAPVAAAVASAPAVGTGAEAAVPVVPIAPALLAAPTAEAAPAGPAGPGMPAVQAGSTPAMPPLLKVAPAAAHLTAAHPSATHSPATHSPGARPAVAGASAALPPPGAAGAQQADAAGLPGSPGAVGLAGAAGSAGAAAGAAAAGGRPVDVEPTLGRVELPSLGLPRPDRVRPREAAPAVAGLPATSPPATAAEPPSAAPAAAAGGRSTAASTVPAAPMPVAQRLPAAAAPEGPPVFALSTRLLRTRAESELTMAAMRSLLLTAGYRDVQVEIMPVGEDWRVVGWPFAQRAQADKARSLLSSRGMRLEVVDF